MGRILTSRKNFVRSPLLFLCLSFPSDRKSLERFRHRFSTKLVAAKHWTILAFAAGMTAGMTYFIDTMVAVLFDYKYGFCKSMFSIVSEICVGKNLSDIRLMAFEQKKMPLSLYTFLNLLH